MKVRFGAMRSRAIRALCVAGLFAFAANGAQADSAARKASGTALDLTAYTTAGDFDAIAPRTRLAGQFDLDASDTLPELVPSRLDEAGRVALLDGVSLDFGTGADLAGRFNSYDAGGSRAYDGLFFQAGAVNSPYAALTDGGSFLSSTVDLSDDLHMTLGESSLASGVKAFPAGPDAALARLGGVTGAYDTRSANSLLAGVSLDFAPWGGAGFTASQTAEHDGVLGRFDPAIRSADTSALGVSARVQLGDGWMTTASFAQAITKLDMKPGLGAPGDDLHTRSYGIAVAKRGVFGNDAMGLAVTRPAGGGATEFDLMSGIGARPQVVPENFLIDTHAPETDFELGYVTTFLDGSLALQTNAAYQMNFAGQSGSNAVSFLSRAKIKF